MTYMYKCIYIWRVNSVYSWKFKSMQVGSYQNLIRDKLFDALMDPNSFIFLWLKCDGNWHLFIFPLYPKCELFVMNEFQRLMVDLRSICVHVYDII